MKQCIRCGNHKPAVEFYEHPRMADGRLNKCKVCCRADALLNRRSRLEHYRQYDRERFSTLRRQETVHSHQKRHRSVNPEKYRARTAVGNAIRAGSLVRGPCEVCGNAASEAHHDDYSRPLDVRWLCRPHHLEHHGHYITQSAS
jgi:hypothetical protein